MRIYCIKIIALSILGGWFFSCNHWGSRENRRMMRQAELLISLMPDSVLVLLNSVDTRLFDEADRAEYTLLRVRAKDNIGLDLSADIEIFQAREYFTKEKNFEKAALSCYYSGKIADYRGNVQTEMDYYREALEFAEKDNNRLLQGKILYDMGYRNFDRLWYEDAISRYHQALEIFQSISGQQQHEIYVLIAIGNSFTAEQKPDSAQFYFNEAVSKAQLFDDPATQVKTYISLMEAYTEIGLFDTGKYFGLQALNLANNSIEKMDIYKNFAQLFLNENKSDSARHYIAMAESFIDDIDNKYELINFYHLSYLIEKRTGNDSKALEYFELYSKHRMELFDWNEGLKLIEAQHKYEIAQIESQYNKDRSTTWGVIGILGIVSFLLTIVVLLVHKKNINQDLALTRVNQETTEAKHQLKILQHLHQKHRTAIQQTFLEKLEIIKDMALLTQIEKKQMNTANLVAKVNAIVSKFTTQKFINSTNSLYPEFTVKLINTFPNASLSENEINVCCLVVCGFTNKELALFIYQKKDTQAVEKLKNRIRKKLDIPAYMDIQKILFEQIINR
jgi:tetratricopeptide (TPR) repeat protein